MEKIPRHEFVDDGLRPMAYEDRPLHIGLKQTISQPYIVARMLQNFEETIGKFQTDTSTHRQLKVGMGPALSRRMLLRAIPSFQERYPEVRLVLLGINDPAEIGNEGIDVLIRPRSTRPAGEPSWHRDADGVRRADRRSRSDRE